MAKDTVVMKSSSLYRNRQTKSLESGGRELRELRCHTFIKLHLRAQHHNDGDGFLLVKFGPAHSQHPATGCRTLT